MPRKIDATAHPYLPPDHSLAVLRQSVQQCRGCDLYRQATQAVFGEIESGAPAKNTRAPIMVVGEQPGDSEDKEGP